jgi:hypothetical protein
MTGNTLNLTILTLTVNDLNASIKRQNRQTVLQNHTQPYIAYKRLISLKKINTVLESKGEKVFPSKWTPQTGRNSYTYH